MNEPKRHIYPSVLRQKADNGRPLMLSPEILRELADYIEWMQQRIAAPAGSAPPATNTRSKQCDAPAN